MDIWGSGRGRGFEEAAAARQSDESDRQTDTQTEKQQASGKTRQYVAHRDSGSTGSTRTDVIHLCWACLHARCWTQARPTTDPCPRPMSPMPHAHVQTHAAHPCQLEPWNPCTGMPSSGAPARALLRGKQGWTRPTLHPVSLPRGMGPRLCFFRFGASFFLNTTTKHHQAHHAAAAARSMAAKPFDRRHHRASLALPARPSPLPSPKEAAKPHKSKVQPPQRDRLAPSGSPAHAGPNGGKGLSIPTKMAPNLHNGVPSLRRFSVGSESNPWDPGQHPCAVVLAPPLPPACLLLEPPILCCYCWCRCPPSKPPIERTAVVGGRTYECGVVWLVELRAAKQPRGRQLRTCDRHTARDGLLHQKGGGGVRESPPDYEFDVLCPTAGLFLQRPTFPSCCPPPTSHSSRSLPGGPCCLLLLLLLLLPCLMQHWAAAVWCHLSR